MSVQRLYIFAGSDSYWATTSAADGTNLPPEHGPWRHIKSVPSSDPRLDQGIDKGTLEDIRARGFSLRRIVISFDPPTTSLLD